MSSDAEVPADRAPILGTGLPGRVLLDVNMGYEVQQLTQSGEYVEITAARFEPDADLGHAEAPARRQVRSRCVAGADGANSFVREKLGIGVADLGFEEKTPACRCPCPPLPPRARRVLAQLATPPPGTIPLVPSAHPPQPPICPGQLAIDGCSTILASVAACDSDVLTSA